MVRTHGADIHGLHTAHAAEVLDLHAGEIAQRVCYGLRAQPLQGIA